MSRVQRALGLALVPWVLAGGVAAIVVNHTRGLSAGCDEASAQQAELVAQRALGHLMVGASLAGEVVDLVEGSAAWVDSDEGLERAPDAELPAWAHTRRLSGFELPPGVEPPASDALLAFSIDDDLGRWACTLALDGALDVTHGPHAGEAFGALGPEARDDVAAVALVDLVAATGLAWALTSCVVLPRKPARKRGDLLALAAGTGALAVFVTTL